MSIRIDGFGDEAAPSLPSNPGMPTVEGQFFKVRLSSSDWFSTRLGVIIAVMRTKVGLSASGESEHHANVAFHASLFGTTRSPQLVKVTNEQTEQTSV